MSARASLTGYCSPLEKRPRRACLEDSPARAGRLICCQCCGPKRQGRRRPCLFRTAPAPAAGAPADRVIAVCRIIHPPNSWRRVITDRQARVRSGFQPNVSGGKIQRHAIITGYRMKGPALLLLPKRISYKRRTALFLHGFSMMPTRTGCRSNSFPARRVEAGGAGRCRALARLQGASPFATGHVGRLVRP